MNTATLNSDYADERRTRATTTVPSSSTPSCKRLRSAGLDPDRLDIDDLAPLDEFHALGRAATLALAELSGLTATDRVLDVGAGIGGPARFLAARYGARVTALDATQRFCAVAELLTRGAGLADRVQVVHGDARRMPFADGEFDLVWTQAMMQNVAEKGQLIAELVRVLAPGGRLALFELVAGPGGASSSSRCRGQTGRPRAGS